MRLIRLDGSGLKPIGSGAAQPLTIRMDDDMRRQLEAAAAGESLEGPSGILVRKYFRGLGFPSSRNTKSSETRRYAACAFLLAWLTHHIVEPLEGDWRSNPFFTLPSKLLFTNYLMR